MSLARRLLALLLVLPVLAGCVASHVVSSRTVDAGTATVDRLLVIYEPRVFRGGTPNQEMAASMGASTLAELVPHLQARLPVVFGARGIPTRMVSGATAAQPEPGEKVLRLWPELVFASTGGHTIAMRAVLEDPARGATMWVGRLLLGNNGLGKFDDPGADKISAQLLEQMQRQSLLARQRAPAPAVHGLAPAAAPAMPAVPASGFAQLDDIDAIPYLNDRGRQVYRDWLQMPAPRAFALSPDGHYSFTSGLRPREANDPSDPTERALAVRERAAKVTCKLYAVNGAVVWVK